MSEWQPIETAPNDGTRVLIYVPAFNSIHACGFVLGCWQTGVWTRNLYRPSHWMPLPEAPK